MRLSTSDQSQLSIQSRDFVSTNHSHQPVKMIPHLREMSQNITNKPMLDEHDRGYKCLSLIVQIKTVCQARGSGDLEVKIDIHY